MQATTDRHPLLACTLTAGALQRRLAWIHRVTRESLLTHRVDGPMLALSYRIDAKADLERIVAQERLCCPFLRFELREVQDTVRLTIEAPVGQGDDARCVRQRACARLRLSARQLRLTGGGATRL